MGLVLFQAFRDSVNVDGRILEKNLGPILWILVSRVANTDCLFHVVAKTATDLDLVRKKWAG